MPKLSTFLKIVVAFQVIYKYTFYIALYILKISLNKCHAIFFYYSASRVFIYIFPENKILFTDNSYLFTLLIIQELKNLLYKDKNCFIS